MLSRVIARQSGMPSGLLGRLWGPLLDNQTRRTNAHALDVLAPGADDDLLEVGFGGGAALAALLARTQGRVAGLELSRVMLRRAARRFEADLRSGRLVLEEGTVAAIPFGDAQFDAALSVHTLYFWPDVEAGLEELLRVLRPGGRVVLGTVAKEHMEGRRYVRHGFRLLDDDALEEALRAAGFEAVSTRRDDYAVATSGFRPRTTV